MDSNLGIIIKPTRKTGDEKFFSSMSGMRFDFDVLSFWQWSASDLVSNATRGVLAEFIVAQALRIPMDVREEWGAYDLALPSGFKIEIKSAAYLQRWKQKKLSPIVFSIKKSREWDAETNLQSDESKRQADVYVFALLKHQEKSSLNPLDIDQWEFYVLPTSVLNERKRSQHSITLKSLQLLAKPVTFSDLRAEVAKIEKEK